MNTDERRSQSSVEVAEGKNHRFFGFSGAEEGKAENAERAEARREIGFCYFIELWREQPLL